MKILNALKYIFTKILNAFRINAIKILDALKHIFTKIFVAGAVALQGFASSPEHIATHAPL
jgi:hypothetical protein